MGLFDRFTSFLEDRGWRPSDPEIHRSSGVNPATGLPMVGGTGGIDVVGNPFGMNLSSHRFDSTSVHSHGTGSMFDQHRSSWSDSSWTSGIGSGNDPWRY